MIVPLFLRRAAPLAALLALVLIVALVGPAGCRHSARRAAEARVANETRRAADGNGRDAVATAGSASRRERDSEALTASNQREIRDAQGANRAVDDAATAAGLDGLCRRAAYRDDSRCRLRRAAAR